MSARLSDDMAIAFTYITRSVKEFGRFGTRSKAQTIAINRGGTGFEIKSSSSVMQPDLSSLQPRPNHLHTAQLLAVPAQPALSARQM
jgi:hypothetical protein